MDKLKVLVFIRKFAENYPKHKHKYDMVTALEEFADITYWHKSGDLIEILGKLPFKPDFIFHYDIAWNNAFAPRITGLNQTDILKGCMVIDPHWLPSKRMQYFKESKIDLIFSITKYPFLKTYFQYKKLFRWWPFSINSDIIKDWELEKDINFLLMGQFYYQDSLNPPKRLPPKGRYSFRECVFNKMKDKKGFCFVPHPGHLAPYSNQLMANENYGRQLNRAKIFFTCGSNLGYPVAKFFEAPGCRTLLLAKPNKDIEGLGFQDGVNYVACNERTFYGKAKYYLTNDSERTRITNNGYEFIHKFHTNRVRAKEFIESISEFIDSKNRR